MNTSSSIVILNSNNNNNINNDGRKRKKNISTRDGVEEIENAMGTMNLNNFGDIIAKINYCYNLNDKKFINFLKIMEKKTNHKIIISEKISIQDRKKIGRDMLSTIYAYLEEIGSVNQGKKDYPNVTEKNKNNNYMEIVKEIISKVMEFFVISLHNVPCTLFLKNNRNLNEKAHLLCKYNDQWTLIHFQIGFGAYQNDVYLTRGVVVKQYLKALALAVVNKIFVKHLIFVLLHPNNNELVFFSFGFDTKLFYETIDSEINECIKSKYDDKILQLQDYVKIIT